MRVRGQDKWRTAKLLQQDPATVLSQPVTVPFNRKNLQEMTQRFPVLYLKPIDGCQSKKIIRIGRLHSRFTILTGKKYHRVRNEKNLYFRLRQMIGHRRYIIQQGICCTTPDGNHFDIRVHLLYMEGKWKVGGIVGRVGAPRAIVTSYRHGGTPISIDSLLTQVLRLDTETSQRIKKKIEKTALHAAQVVHRTYPAKKELSIDLGLDQSKRVWIFEVNYMWPAIQTFRKADPSTYKNILHMRKKVFPLRNTSCAGPYCTNHAENPQPSS